MKHKVALSNYAAKVVSPVIKVAYGGPHRVFNEETFFDEISVVPQTPLTGSLPSCSVFTNVVGIEILITAKIESSSADDGVC